MASIEDTLADRGKQYGDFTTHGAVTQDLKNVARAHSGWNNLAPYQKEAIDMIAHKIGRILNGNPNIQDSWHDIAGYATLVADRVNE